MKTYTQEQILAALETAFSLYYDKGLTNTAASVKEKFLGELNIPSNET